MKTKNRSLFFLKIGIMLSAILLLFPPVISKADDEFDIEQIGEPINVTTNYTKSGKKVEKSTNAIIGDLIDVTISKSAPKTSASCGNGHSRTTVSLSGGSATAYVELLDADGVVLDKFTLTTLQIPLSDYPDLDAIHLYSYVKDSSGKCSTCGATLSGSSGSASAKVTFYKRIIKGPRISSNLTDLVAVEGRDAIFHLGVTTPTGENDIDWEYTIPVEGFEPHWATITPSTKIYSVRDNTGTASEPVYGPWRIASAIDESGIAQGRFTESNGQLKITSFEEDDASGELIIKNPTTIMTGFGFRATAKSENGNVTSDVAGLTVLKTNYSSLECLCSNQYFNIGTEIDPLNRQQFTLLVGYSNGTSNFFASREARFFVDPSTTSVDEIVANFRTEIPTPDTNDVLYKETVADGVLATVGVYESDGVLYGAFYNSGDNKWYYSKYITISSLDDVKDGDNISGSLIRNVVSEKMAQLVGTSSEATVQYDTEGHALNTEPYTMLNAVVKKGLQTYFVILPDFNNPSCSLIAPVDVNGVDTEGPKMDPITAHWVSWNDATGTYDELEEYTPSSKVVKPAGFTMRLSVANIVDNNSAADALTYQWYRNDEEIPGANATELILPLEGEDNSNGVYTFVAFDDADPVNSTVSDAFDLSNTWDTECPIVNVSITPDTPSTYKELFIEAIDDNLADKPYALVGPVDTDYDCLTPPDEDSEVWSAVNNYIVSENGLYYVYVRDVVGNTSLWNNPSGGGSAIEITDVDHSAPAIHGVDVVPSTDDDGNPNYIDPETGDQYITIIVDAGEDGEYLEYMLEHDGAVIRDWQPEPVFDLIEEGGNYIVYVRDSAGNISKYEINNIDKDAILGNIPGSELAKVFGIQVRTNNQNYYWTNQDIVVELIGGDMSILAPMPFSVDGGANWTNERQYIMTQNGTFSLTIKDIYGNTYNYISFDINCIDKVDPDFTATPTSGKNNTIQVNASDLESGLDEVYYFFNGGNKRPAMVYNENTHEGQATIVVDKVGTYDIYVSDKAGNVTNKPIEITNSIPDNELFEGTEEDIANKITAMISANPSTWTKNNVTLTFSPASTSGFANNPYSWDNGVNWLNSQNYTASSNGDYVLLVKDIYGNQYHSNVISVNNIDKLAPSMEVEQQGNNLIISSTDAQSGVERIAWLGGTVTSATTIKSFTGNQGSVQVVAELPSNGSYTIYAYDEAGNINTVTKTATGVTTNTGNNSSNTTNNSGSGNTIEKYYYNNNTEKTVPVYVDKYVNSGSGSSGSSGGSYSGGSGSTYSSPSYQTTTTPIKAATTPTTTQLKTTTPTPTPVAASTTKKVSKSTATTATSKPSTGAQKLKTEVVAASPVTTGETENTEVLADENLAKYRNSRVAGGVNATSDNGKSKGINIVLGIIGGLIALSGIAAGVYYYTTKYKPALVDGELSKEDYAFAEDIALAQSDESDNT